MTDPLPYIFLLHHTPPLGLGIDPILLCVSANSKVTATSFECLSQSKSPIVTHSFSLLVDWFRQKSLPLPTKVLDLELAKRLIVGRPKTDFNSEKPWDMPSMVQELVPTQYDPKQVRAAFTAHMSKPTATDFGNMRLMAAVTAGLPMLWSQTCDELEERSEIRRFEEIEVPAYNAMLDAQYRGLKIDTNARHIFLELIEQEYAFAHHQLAIRQGVDVDRALVDVEYLGSLLVHGLRDDDLIARPRDVIDSRRDYDPVCSLLHSVKSCQVNKSILLRTPVTDEFCFVAYDTMGTVTGRIMAVDPRMQHLNKKYRKIIVADSDRKLVYIDYAQFEPNILASISNDNLLLALCNAGDLYENLAVELCGSAEYRETVKLMFLAYLYGKDSTGLTDYLVGLHGSTREDAEVIIEKRFLPLFSGIEGWKSSVEGELSNSGRIGTLLGNHRYRRREGELNAKERRWAVSQVIQGTGALILKKLIIMVRNRLPEVAILLPMFDALLVEVPEKSAVEVTHELLNCFREAFSDTCPSVSPSVWVKPFAHTSTPATSLLSGGYEGNGIE
jgi:DNA polymerase family A